MTTSAVAGCHRQQRPRSSPCPRGTWAVVYVARICHDAAGNLSVRSALGGAFHDPRSVRADPVPVPVLRLGRRPRATSPSAPSPPRPRAGHLPYRAGVHDPAGAAVAPVITCLATDSSSGQAQVITNLTARPHGLGTWEPKGITRCGCRRWVCRDCGSIQHHARPLPWPAQH